MNAWTAGLRRWGTLQSRRLEETLESLADSERDGPLLKTPPGDAPWISADGALEFSRRLTVLLAEALEIAPGTRVALPYPPPRLLRRLVEGMGGRLFDPLRDEHADRSVELAPMGRKFKLSDGGFALRLGFEPFKESLVKRVQSGDQVVDLRLENLKLAPQEPALGAGDPSGRTIRQMIVLEGFCRRALRSDLSTEHDHRFADAVERTWNPAAAHASAMTRDARSRLGQARTLFHLAYIHQFVGNLGDSADLYEASIRSFPTAEAHTFLGWVRSMGGDFVAGIEECRSAIALDPDLGNPYNDIGAYLLELGRPAEALPWLQRAIRAPRYEAPHFAHCNAGRSLLQLGRKREALAAFRQALRLEPDYEPARELLRRSSGADSPESSSRPR